MYENLREQYGIVMKNIILGYETGMTPYNLTIESTRTSYIINIPLDKNEQRLFAFRQPNIQKDDFERDVDTLFNVANKEGIVEPTLKILLRSQENAIPYDNTILTD